MANQEILGGLASALSRGESLQKAMFSFFNAGYSKDEIEEAARVLKSQTSEQILQNKVESEKEKFLNSKEVKEKEKEKKEPEKKEEPKQETQKKPEKEKKSSGEFENVIDQTIKSLSDLKSSTKVVKSNSDFKPPIIIQRVSGYGDQKSMKKPSKVTIILLFILLALLLGALAALFLFKDQLIEIFNNFNF